MILSVIREAVHRSFKQLHIQSLLPGTSFRLFHGKICSVWKPKLGLACYFVCMCRPVLQD